MDLIVLDFETPYGKGYTLQGMTYEEYIFDERFKVFLAGITVNGESLGWLYGDALTQKLHELFPPGNKNVLICHNTMFDGAILSWHYGLSAGMYLCTQGMSRALWNQQSASLDALAKRCFPDDKTKRKGKELANFKDIYELNDAQREILGGYCVQDVALTHDCFWHMNRFFPNDELRILDMTLRLFIHPPFRADISRLSTYKSQLEARRKKAILDSGLPEKTLTSNDKFAEWILEQGIPLEKVPSPTPSNPDNTKWPLSKDDAEFIEIQARYPQFAHVWEGRIQAKSPGELRRTERLLTHASLHHGEVAVPLNYCAAHTMRFGGTNKVNFQNFKRGSEIRYALLAPEGYQVDVQDLSNIEARLLAWFAQESVLLTAYREKQDVYSQFASRVFGYAVNKNDHPTERFVGKTCILGLGYGVGEAKLQHQLFLAGLDYSLRKCWEMKTLYRTTYRRIPELWRTADAMIAHMFRKDATPMQWGPLVVEHQRIRMPNGLYLNYPGLRMSHDEAGRFTGFEYWNGKHWTNLYGGKLIENIIQCLARILLTSAMLKINDELCIIGGRIALNVHDEVASIIPTDHAKTYDEKIAEILRTPPEWCADGTLVLETEGGYATNYSK